MSANRYLLIPEDLWKGMLSSKDTGDANLDLARRTMEGVRRERLDPTTKNALYNQELRRYLHLQKEHENKPVKVEVTGGLPLQSGSPSPSSPPPSVGGANAPRRRKPKRSPLSGRKLKTPKRLKRAANGDQSEEDEDGDKTLGFETPRSTPQAADPAAAGPSSSSSGEVNALIVELEDWLKQNQRFGVLPDGRIISDSGHPVKQSDVKRSLEWMVKDKAQKGQERQPPGTKHLMSNVQTNPQFKDKFAKIMEAKGAQTGKGFPHHHNLKKHSTKSKESKATHNKEIKSGFTPKLWTQH